MADFGITLEGPRSFFVNGELDMATVPIMNIATVDAVARGGPISMALTDVTFMDTTGVGTILKAANDLPSGCIILHGVHDGGPRSLRADGPRDGRQHPRHPVHPRRPSFRGLASHR